MQAQGQYHGLGCPAQELDAHLISWAQLAGDRYGLVTVDIPHLPRGAAFPAAALAPLLGAWRFLRAQPPVLASELLVAAARAGLVPRPDSSIRFSRCHCWGSFSAPYDLQNLMLQQPGGTESGGLCMLCYIRFACQACGLKVC